MSQIKPLSVSIIQYDIIWESPEANRANLEEIIWEINQPTDIILLPEMFTTGFSMNVKNLAEPMNLYTHKWMLQMAQQMKAAIAGTVIISEQGKFYNRFLWVQPDGKTFFYDKKHLFSMAEETKYFSAGIKDTIIEWRGFKIKLQVCYDLRFPVWSKNTKDDLYDLICYVANWPDSRASAWNAFLPARAMENSAYCIGVNRVGSDGMGLSYQGDSQVWSPKGICLWKGSTKEQVHTLELDLEQLQAYRVKFPLQNDWDRFTIHSDS